MKNVRRRIMILFIFKVSFKLAGNIQGFMLGYYLPSCPQLLLNILLNSDRRTVTLNSHIIPLRNKEYELLEFFVLNKGRLITRHSLIEGVWDRNAKVSSNTLDVHIGRLRKKLEQWLTSKFIHTVHSIGYRFDLDCK